MDWQADEARGAKHAATETPLTPQERLQIIRLYATKREEVTTAWMCACGHNRSAHRQEWDRFRGRQDTSCSHIHPDKTVCRCAAFTEAA